MARIKLRFQNGTACLVAGCILTWLSKVSKLIIFLANLGLVPWFLGQLQDIPRFHLSPCLSPKSNQTWHCQLPKLSWQDNGTGWVIDHNPGTLLLESNIYGCHPRDVVALDPYSSIVSSAGPKEPEVPPTPAPAPEPAPARLPRALEATSRQFGDSNGQFSPPKWP